MDFLWANFFGAAGVPFFLRMLFGRFFPLPLTFLPRSIYYLQLLLAGPQAIEYNAPLPMWFWMSFC
jgi:hypothetical protein